MCYAQIQFLALKKNVEQKQQKTRKKTAFTKVKTARKAFLKNMPGHFDVFRLFNSQRPLKNTIGKNSLPFTFLKSKQVVHFK